MKHFKGIESVAKKTGKKVFTPGYKLGFGGILDSFGSGL